MSSLPIHNYISGDPLDEPSGLISDPSIYFDEEEPLFPAPLSGEGILHFNESTWQNAGEMTGNGSPAQPWQDSAQMTRNDSSGTNQSHQSNEQFNFSAAPPAPAPTQTTTLRSVEMPVQNSSSPSPAGSLLDSNSPRDMRPRKRKSSPLTDEDDEEDETPESPPRPPLKKTAHNMIEKRYRTNLNDKIAALKQSVPSLRATEKSLSGKGGNKKLADMIEDLDGLIPPNKLNKATILSKATEYISHLERRNQSLNTEKKALLDRINTFEDLILSRKHHNQQMYHHDQHQLLLQHQMMEHNNVDRRSNMN